MVPSRHTYPEGLPNVIYEGLASRTPLVLSDHPAFLGRVAHETAGLVFAAGDPGSLAATLVRLSRSHDLYHRLSQHAAACHDALYLGLEWERLMTLFLQDPGNRTRWVEENALAALGHAT